MSKPSLKDKKGKIYADCSIITVRRKPMMEIFGLRNWLISLNLLNCYAYLYALDLDELLNITERQIFKLFRAEHVFKLVDSMDEVRAQRSLILKLKRKILDTTYDLNLVFKELEAILPDQFAALLGPIPTFFVDAMQLVWVRMRKIKSQKVKQDYQHTFYKLCLRGELSENFMEADKEYLRKWRVIYQTERKLLKEQAQQAKK